MMIRESFTLSLSLPLHLQCPGSTEGDFPSPGADLSPAVRDPLPTPEPAQSHPGGQVNPDISG